MNLMVSRDGRRAPAEGKGEWKDGRDFDEIVFRFCFADGIVTRRETRASGGKGEWKDGGF